MDRQGVCDHPVTVVLAVVRWIGFLVQGRDEDHLAADILDVAQGFAEGQLGVVLDQLVGQGVAVVREQATLRFLVAPPPRFLRRLPTHRLLGGPKMKVPVVRLVDYEAAEGHSGSIAFPDHVGRPPILVREPPCQGHRVLGEPLRLHVGARKLANLDHGPPVVDRNHAVGRHRTTLPGGYVDAQYILAAWRNCTAPQFEP